MCGGTTRAGWRQISVIDISPVKQSTTLVNSVCEERVDKWRLAVTIFDIYTAKSRGWGPRKCKERTGSGGDAPVGDLDDNHSNTVQIREQSETQRTCLRIR